MIAARWRVVVLVSMALVADAALGALAPAAARAPAAPLAVVAAVAISRGVEVGAVTGFATGIVLDLLAGEQAIMGAHALGGLLVGVLAALVHRYMGQETQASGIVVGAAAVGAGTVASGLLRSVIGTPWASTMGSVAVRAAIVGAVLTPIARHFVQKSVDRPLRQRSKSA